MPIPLLLGALLLSVPPAPTPLAFSQFFQASRLELKASPTLLGLNGRRVRMTGWIARLEAPPRGAFFLCPRPTFCDEEGAGTADLPPQTVRVIVRGLKGDVMPWTPRPVVVTGVLQVGPRAEADGSVSAIRLILDRAAPLRAVKRPASLPSPVKH